MKDSTGFNCIAAVLLMLFCSTAVDAQSSAVKSVLPHTVKIVGSGGMRGLEAYQSGILISSEGHVLTAWSYVLDSASTVTTNDGERFQCKLLGYDAKLEIAVVKIDAEGLPHVDLASAVDPAIGTPILAFCNCYGVATGDEPVSVQRGVVSAKTKLAAKRGSWQIPYTDDVFILDAITSNPGSAGGMVCDVRGRPVGLIGKESQDARTGLWLSYAIPFSKLTESVNRILDGKNLQEQNMTSRRTAEPLDPQLLGFALVPEVLNRTPPYIEFVREKTVAFRAGLLADDLVIEINGLPTASCRDVAKRLGQVDRDSPVTITIQRGSEFLTVTMSLLESN
ncbi:S1C family serine protease [Mariniblastus fucicola]|uniref:Serine protease HhoB n=1 Tax=Mariniblastus fucicola TaxID=980251 RepID=A0A5B9P934_9BACT|nr:S1C family serine protease [Mariniblastus fucicola]QEG21745.1 Putative serine protease HhoB precursor [Mariniblastus fucicola]